MNEKLRAHYKDLLLKYGDSAESAQYSSRESQERRFEILAQISDLNNTNILDFGCGSGHLATYLKSRNMKFSYTGVDVVEEFFDVARAKNPGDRFGLLQEFTQEKFDFVFVSGVFNNKRKGNRRFYQDSLRTLFGMCTKGIAFNMMSTYVDYRDSGLFYESPERAFRFVKQELTPFVCLRHDYEVKPGIVPFEYAIYAYRVPPVQKVDLK
ncbi:MAG: class I SAM-dependent methyltransferase [Gammaproteobacteria bacterium]|nr:class I SAM-dependent methyltransferase [Gammaproteobacteria bacterium]MBU1776214.1 class I SAM-dependent methyltransferase [Gammaproteobacteria bacterium]